MALKNGKIFYAGIKEQKAGFSKSIIELKILDPATQNIIFTSGLPYLFFNKSYHLISSRDYFFLHVDGVKRMSIGKISRRPVIISKIYTHFEGILKAL